MAIGSNAWVIVEHTKRQSKYVFVVFELGDQIRSTIRAERSELTSRRLVPADKRLSLHPSEVPGADCRPRPEGSAVGLAAHVAMAIQRLPQRTRDLKGDLPAKTTTLQMRLACFRGVGMEHDHFLRCFLRRAPDPMKDRAHVVERDHSDRFRICRTVRPSSPQLSKGTSSITTKVDAGDLPRTFCNNPVTPATSCAFSSCVGPVPSGPPSRVTLMFT